jgi:predicted ATP-dependent endonuclease of OLD family
MIIENLTLKNIGPFENAFLDFSSLENGIKPVIIITGENGTGKSVIIDAVRTLFLGLLGQIERDITSSTDFYIGMKIEMPDGERLDVVCNSRTDDGRLQTNNFPFNALFASTPSSYKSNFVVNYWSSKLSNDSFNISNIETPITENFLSGSLSGIHTNVEVTKLIAFFDYLSDSKDPLEKAVGMKMFEMISLIINTSLAEGTLSHISRTKLQPIISVRNREISLDKLSSGNLYLIQRLIYLLKQMYSVCINYNIPINEIQNTKGMLLIDEAENHLHPKWQKIFLRRISELFPNLQLIVTTHSPFIVSSIENSRVFVCTSQANFSIVKEETDFYSNKPVEEILMSPLFNTNNFNSTISNLLQSRKKAVVKNDLAEITRIEKALLDANPDYFSYLNLDALIKSIKNEGS